MDRREALRLMAGAATSFATLEPPGMVFPEVDIIVRTGPVQWYILEQASPFYTHQFKMSVEDAEVVEAILRRSATENWFRLVEDLE